MRKKLIRRTLQHQFNDQTNWAQLLKLLKANNGNKKFSNHLLTTPAKGKWWRGVGVSVKGSGGDVQAIMSFHRGKRVFCAAA